jgi:signal transduction histidine kinase
MSAGDVGPPAGGLWRRLVGHRPIVTRLVLAVALAMGVVLLLTSGFLFWRVSVALDRQVDQDLTAYRETVEGEVADGEKPPSDTPGQSYQVYDVSGRIVASDAEVDRLVSIATVRAVAAGNAAAGDRRDVGAFLPASEHPYRVVASRVRSPDGTVVVATAISERKHDEALRELLLQLLIADLSTLLAASVVGYGTARAALGPVEQYRQAAAAAGGDPDGAPVFGRTARSTTRQPEHEAPLLPVADDRDDEVTRLGHTFNALLRRLNLVHQRERQFLADASHELRSPLALMRTEIEVAQLAPQHSPDTAATFDSLRGEVERLISLTNALLDLEELHANDEAVLEEIDVSCLLATVAARFTSLAAEAGREITVEAPDGLHLEGHPHWLQLALTNLVSNALHHGEGTVQLVARIDSGWIRMTVADDGPGFGPDFVDKAFDRFSRADTSRSTRGTGLGLALVQAVAEAHRGTASIVDAGAGTRVVLDLPATPPRSTPPP